jgi:hypothetical protein
MTPYTITAGIVKDIQQIALTIPLQAGDKFYIQAYIPNSNEAFGDNFYDPQIGNFNIGNLNFNASDPSYFNNRQNYIKDRVAITSGHLYTT